MKVGIRFWRMPRSSWPWTGKSVWLQVVEFIHSNGLLRSEVELPVLAGEILAKAGMSLLPRQLEAVRLVNVAGGVENAVRPERELLVFRLSSKSDAFVDETVSDSLSARRASPGQQPELRDGGGARGREDR